MELKKGDIIFIKDRSELELKYTGWNNGHIFEFYTLKFTI